MLDDLFAIDEEWWSEDLTKWPELEFGNLYTYLIKSKGVYMPKSLDAYKSLEAYNYYYNLHVRTVYHYDVVQGWSMLKAKVNPGQKLADNPYEIWIMVKTQTGYVRNGHCKC